MIDEKKLRELSRISGFGHEEGKNTELLADMNEIIGIVDKIKDFDGEFDYTAASYGLKDLREDKPTLSVMAKQEDISVARMVQDD